MQELQTIFLKDGKWMKRDNAKKPTNLMKYSSAVPYPLDSQVTDREKALRHVG